MFERFQKCETHLFKEVREDLIRQGCGRCRDFSVHVDQEQQRFVDVWLNGGRAGGDGYPIWRRDASKDNGINPSRCRLCIGKKKTFRNLGKCITDGF